MAEEKAGGVELFAAADHLHDRALWGTGDSLLHELCHAWHDAHVAGGFENAAVRDAYTRAMRARKYDAVRVHGPQGAGGRACRHYACTNAMEFFAELSVAFLYDEARHRGAAGAGVESAAADADGGGAFDTIVCPACDDGSGTSREYNKWYPFNNAQLREHDPETHALLEELWFPPDDGDELISGAVEAAVPAVAAEN